MGREMATIKGAEVKSVHLGESWITVTIRIPYKAVLAWGNKRNPKSVPRFSKGAVKANQNRNRGAKNG